MNETYEYVNVYKYDKALALEGDCIMELNEAEEQIKKYEKQALIETAQVNRDGFFLYGAEQIDFNIGIVASVFLFSPRPITVSEMQELFEEYPDLVLYYMESVRKESKTLIRHIRPCTLRQANDFVEAYHRHNAPVVSYKFAISLTEEEADGSERLIGVVIAGRPVARALDDNRTIEITRLCVVEGNNSCSSLYAAACRTAQDMGYEKAITYTLSSEPGNSLLSAGFHVAAQGCGGVWTGTRSRKNRARNPEKLIPTEPKTRWERVLQQRPLIVKL